MKFQPQTEDEVMQEQLCPEGKTTFTVMSAKEKTSKSGKEMIELKLNVHGNDGYDYHIFDYISPEFMAFKFRHFFYSVGLGPQYDAGEVHADILQDREGWCEVGIQKARGEYGPKNIIKDYVIGTTASNPAPERTVAPAPAPKAKAPEPDDDVPF